MRQCVGCHGSMAKSELIRVIKTPEGDILIDATGKKNGRGAYICPKTECFNKARKSKAIERAFGISISEEIYNEIERQMLEFVEK